MKRLFKKFIAAAQPVYETEPTQAAVETTSAQHQALEDYDYLNSLPSLFEQSTNPMYSILGFNIYHDQSINSPFQDM